MTEPNNFYPSYVALCVLNVLLCLTAIMLNSVTIHATRKTLSLQKTLKMLLVSLAVSDLGVGLLVHPLGIAITVLEMTTNVENNSAYKIIFTLFQVPLNLFYYATFFGVTALSVDRFLAIFLHLRYQELVTHKRAAAVVTSIWISSAFLSSLQFWTTSGIRNVIYASIELACLLTTAFLYCKIYQVVRRHTRNIQALQAEPQGDITRTTGRFKSAVGPFYIYIAFLACYLPHNCTYLARVISGSHDNLNGIVTHLVRYTVTLTWFNSSLNPLIFSWKIKPIRSAIKNIGRNNILKRPN